MLTPRCQHHLPSHNPCMHMFHIAADLLTDRYHREAVQLLPEPVREWVLSQVRLGTMLSHYVVCDSLWG